MAAEEFGRAVTAKGEHFTHKVLWRTAKVQIESAIGSEQGSFYCALGGMVFAFHAFEAYLNFLGERLAPDVWQDERNFFPWIQV